jgi:hypothetical protein
VTIVEQLRAFGNGRALKQPTRYLSLSRRVAPVSIDCNDRAESIAI